MNTSSTYLFNRNGNSGQFHIIKLSYLFLSQTFMQLLKIIKNNNYAVPIKGSIKVISTHFKDRHVLVIQLVLSS